MGGFPDVRLDGVSHGEIVQWVRGGKADSTTQGLEAQLQQIVQLLHDSGEDVNKAVQRANAGDWQGTTAESAHGAMVTMRDYDDAMHGHSENTRYSAMGQSGESSAKRSRIPEPASPQGGQGPQLVNATEDPHAQLAAKRSAEQQARQVMGEYRDATRARVAALPSIPPVPKVVLGTGSDAPAPKAGGNSPGSQGAGVPRVAGGGSQSAASYGSTPAPGGASHGAVVGGQHVSAPPPVQGTDPSSVATPPGVGPGGPGALVPTGNSPVGAAPGEPGGSWVGGPGAPGGSGGYGSAERGAGPGGVGRPGGSGGIGAGGGDSAGGGRGAAGAQPGARSAAGMGGAEEAAMRRGGAGAARAGGAGMGGMMGGGHGAEGDEDSEHTTKYGLPSDEHFEEDDEFLHDPRNREFFVAPDVIGGPE